jgi:DNA-binding NarL/FixJ family response regulator
MNILFLDDDPNRHAYFYAEFSDWATMCHTAQECIDHLARQDWDIVCLDHDLGGEVFVGSDGKNTGMEVIRWIEKNNPKVKVFIVHSWNAPAGASMMLALSFMNYPAIRSFFGPGMIETVKTEMKRLGWLTRHG